MKKNNKTPFIPHGVIPAALTVFNDDYSIDYKSTAKHFAHMANTPGVAGITFNGHAAEVHALTVDEQRRLLELAVETCAGKVGVIAGIYADGSHEAARLAKMCAASGAQALLIFPPQTLMLGGQLRPEMALVHYKMIAEGSGGLPMILFNYPIGTGLGFTWDTICRLIDEVPQIHAMKDWCNDPMRHEQHTRVLQSRPQRPINMLTTHSSWLMASLSMGANGLLSGAGSVIADMQVAMFEAIQKNDLATARAVNDSMYPIVQAFYAPPFLDMHNRMKQCLAILGRIPKAVVRPPLMKLPSAEITRLKQALKAAGVKRDGWQGVGR